MENFPEGGIDTDNDELNKAENEITEDINESKEQEEQEKLEKLLQQQIDDVIGELNDLSKRFNNLVAKPNKNKKIYLQRLHGGKSLLEWTIAKFKLMFEGMPPYVFKRDVFYCDLGLNIGSEQSGTRPVVIIQNDRGNKSAPTTMIVPITTNEGTVKCVAGQDMIEWTDKEGNLSCRRLDYYEIPVKIEPGYRKEITGYINLSQVKTISKKRLKKYPVAKITTDVENKINESLKKMFQIP